MDERERTFVAKAGSVLSLTPGADDGIRTRDPHLGKVMLYQLSHVRVTYECSKPATVHPKQVHNVPGHLECAERPVDGPTSSVESLGSHV